MLAGEGAIPGVIVPGVAQDEATAVDGEEHREAFGAGPVIAWG